MMADLMRAEQYFLARTQDPEPPSQISSSDVYIEDDLM